jgi:2C-methyl-D-erythritol 2,4-cyclodiphosphate synthase
MNIKIEVSANPDKMTQTQSQMIKRVAQVLEQHKFDVSVIWGMPAKALKGKKTSKHYIL